MKETVLTFFLFIIGFQLVAQTTFEGKVTDAETGEAILFGTVAMYKNGVLTDGGETDLDGNYFFSDVDPGTYDVEVSYVGYTTERQVGVIINAGRTNRLDFKLTTGVLVDEVVITSYKVPLIEIDNTSSGGTVTAEKIRTLPTKNINALAASTAGLSSVDDGAINVRGSRSNATDYYIDGIRVSSNSLIPESEIEQLQVITGGLPAEFGDVTGGVISITSKGPSNTYSGGVEMETSQFLDGFGYNQVRGNASGPILKNSEGKSIIGFRLSGQYQYQLDDFPAALGAYRFNEQRIAELEAEPFRVVNGTSFPTAEFLSNSDLGGALNARPNEDRTDINVTAKIDARLTNQIDISVSGSYNDRNNRFTPTANITGTGLTNRDARGWGLLNWTHNPYSYSGGYRGNFKFRHKIGKQGLDKDNKKIESNALIRNFSYTIQGGYEKRNSLQEDVTHEDNFFNYGYLGATERNWNPTATIITDTATWDGQIIFDAIGRPFGHLGYAEQMEGFTPSEEINTTLNQFNNINGTFNSPLNQVWSDLYNNVGQVYNIYSKGETDIYSGRLIGGFDLVPGSSERGRHSIQFGLQYEQRIDRGYTLAPRGLWTLAQLNANRHIIGIDTEQVIGTFPQFIPGGVAEFDQYQTLIETNNDLLFFQRIRELTGQSLNEYVNVDGINPNDLTLDMFSASELNDFGIISYFGYDYLGNKTPTSSTFDDFYTGRDGDRRTFNVAPNKPVYGAFFIQDKFSYKDIIFRLGLRVDYYDANTKVLIDPYSLYEIETASEFFARTGQEKPSAIGEDYRVYIADEGSNKVIGYRLGDQWFQPNGTAVSSGGDLFGGGVVTPALKGATEGRELNIQSPDFDPSTSFKDYEAQINFMPRLAFSFPISENAGFFAHYDVLVQRPPSNTIATGRSYFYFADPNRTPSGNPNLRPEKTIDYEVGFQQKLSNSSAIKVSAYYKELRDMIQSRVITNTFPVTQYTTFDNLDFGTIKGFSFNYDLRRTNNFELTANYTLQFADGSGSDANSSRGINSRGPIRTLSPLRFDERHRINAILDYRYGSGKFYNGPRINDIDIFANTGLNVQITAVSGRPYTQRRTVVPFGGTGFQGGINEARLPWTTKVDLRLDKSFKLFDDGSSGRKALYINAYLRVQNALNTRNVVGVYSVSGDPLNDGYLQSSFGEDRKQQVEDNGQSVSNFVDAYNWRLLDADLFTLPRRIYLGAILEF